MASRTQAQSMRDRLQNLSDDAPKPWIPERPGDYIAGVVVDVNTRTTDYNPECLVITIETDGGELSTVWAMGSVLERDLPAKDFHVGDTLGIRRLNDGTDKKGRPFKMYAILKETAPGNELLTAKPASAASLAGRIADALEDGDLPAALEDQDDDLPF